MISNIKKNTAIGLETPDWLVEKCYYEWGLVLDTHSLLSEFDSFKDHPVVIFEHQLIGWYKKGSDWKIFKDKIQKHNIRKIIILLFDVFYVPESMWPELDSLMEGRECHLICNCWAPTQYKNLIGHVRNNQETEMYDPFVYNLALVFQHKRKLPIKDFFVSVVLKNFFRITVFNAIKEAGILENSFVKTNTLSQNGTSASYGELDRPWDQYDKNLFRDVKNATIDDHYINGLKALQGPGTPIFPAYEQCFCEIVFESRVSGISDITEKTYRPMMLGVPIVFLGSEIMYKKLQDDGYILTGKEFYNKWYAETDIKDKCSHLKDFLKQIVSDQHTRNAMSKAAEHNFKNFWLSRPLENRKIHLDLLNQCFGEDNLLNQIYNRLDY